jgi:hypothetical protein
MKITPTEEFRQAAINEDGQPVSAGGPPFRKLPDARSDFGQDAKFQTQVTTEAVQPSPAALPHVPTAKIS